MKSGERESGEKNCSGEKIFTKKEKGKNGKTLLRLLRF